MTLSSIELATRCHQRGLLSKQAMDEVLVVRNKLIKEALAEKAASVFKSLASAGGKARGFAHDLVSNLGFAGTAAKPTPWGHASGQIIKMLALGGALAGGGAAVQGLMRHSRDKAIKRDIEGSYQEMFNETPGLANMDKDKIRRHFGVLATYAPSLAADPTVAGAWVRGTVQMGHVDASMVERLGATQAMIDRHHEGRALFQPGHFTSGVNLARSAIGGGGDGGRP